MFRNPTGKFFDSIFGFLFESGKDHLLALEYVSNLEQTHNFKAMTPEAILDFIKASQQDLLAHGIGRRKAFELLYLPVAFPDKLNFATAEMEKEYLEFSSKLPGFRDDP